MKKSFTLIELLIVIAIIAIIAVGIIILIIPGERLAQARDATRASHLKNLETALYLYDLDHGLATLGITENLTEICNTELENYDCTGLVDLSSLNITIPTDPLGGNSPNGTGYYLALINNKAVLYATKAETKETKIGIAEGITFIYTWHDLHDIRDNLGDHYILMNNLSSATIGYSDYNTGDGWEPIGDLFDWFEGNFDGNGKTIANLYINRSGTDFIGLFGFLGSTGEIKNINLTNINYTGNTMVGSLAGVSLGDIINVNISGSINGNSIIGGIVGENDKLLSKVSFNGTINSNSYSGGLAGYNIGGTIIDSYSIGSVIVNGNYVGGLVGRNVNVSIISNSYSNSEISGHNYTGGLVGSNEDNSEISNSYFIGTITAMFYDHIGGIVGYQDNGSVLNCYNEGNITGNLRVGGIVGYNSNNGIVINSYNMGNINGGNDIGGIIGHHEDTDIVSCYNTGTIGGDSFVGGITGRNENGRILNSYNTGSIGAFSIVGGLTGLLEVGDIEKSYSSGLINGSSDFGGLVGRNDFGVVANSYYDSQTSGQSDTGRGTPRTTIQMQDIRNYNELNWEGSGLTESWDIAEMQNHNNEDWYINNNNDYPKLGWE